MFLYKIKHLNIIYFNVNNINKGGYYEKFKRFKNRTKFS